MPYNLQDVIDKGTGALNELDPKLLGAGAQHAGRHLGASGPEVLPALQGVDRVSRVVSRRSDQIGQLLTSSRRSPTSSRTAAATSSP